MRFFAILAILCFSVPALAGQAQRPVDIDAHRRDFGEYIERLQAIVEKQGKREAALSSWCNTAGLTHEATAALKRAQACRRDIEVPKVRAIKEEQNPSQAFEAKVYSMRAEVSRSYLDIAKWCLEKEQRGFGKGK